MKFPHNSVQIWLLYNMGIPGRVMLINKKVKTSESSCKERWSQKKSLFQLAKTKQGLHLKGIFEQLSRGWISFSGGKSILFCGWEKVSEWINVWENGEEFGWNWRHFKNGNIRARSLSSSFTASGFSAHVVWLLSCISLLHQLLSLYLALFFTSFTLSHAHNHLPIPFPERKQQDILADDDGTTRPFPSMYH